MLDMELDAKCELYVGNIELPVNIVELNCAPTGKSTIFLQPTTVFVRQEV